MKETTYHYRVVWVREGTRHRGPAFGCDRDGQPSEEAWGAFYACRSSRGNESVHFEKETVTYSGFKRVAKRDLKPPDWGQEL